MTYQTVTLQLPDTIYRSAWRTAKAVKRPVEEVLLTVLKSSLPSLEGLPYELAKELIELEALTNTQLRTIARSTMPQSKQRKLSGLLRKNQAGALTATERSRLDDLTAEAERLMLFRARV